MLSTHRSIEGRHSPPATPVQLAWKKAVLVACVLVAYAKLTVAASVAPSKDVRRAIKVEVRRVLQPMCHPLQSPTS